MKKFLHFLAALILVLISSCSSDDSSSDSDSNLVLPKKFDYVSEGKSHSNQYIYNGNKIVSIIGDDGGKSTYSYTGDLITKIVITDINGAIILTIEYVYINGKLSSRTQLQTGESTKFKIKYTHNTDGTVSVVGFTINAATGVEQDRYEGEKYIYKDGNLTAIEYEGRPSDSSTFEYDTKNNPFKNVLGFNLLLEYDFNNRVKATYSNTVVTHTYKYNVDGFPTEIKTFQNGTSYLATYTYYVF
jgi:hypothetical protein